MIPRWTKTPQTPRGPDLEDIVFTGKTHQAGSARFLNRDCPAAAQGLGGRLLGQESLPKGAPWSQACRGGRERGRGGSATSAEVHAPALCVRTC